MPSSELLNRALRMVEDSPPVPLVVALAREFRTATRDDIDAAVSEASAALGRIQDTVYRVCTDNYATECTSLAKDEVRAVVPWIDEGNLDLLVGRGIVAYYR